jgi:hypothetical protein
MVPISSSLPVLLLLLLNNVAALLQERAERTPKAADPRCTVTNPLTKEFYDLRPLTRHESDKSLQSSDIADCRTDWHVNGYDYGHNFTLNICEPVLSDYSDVVDTFDRRNVSGFYIDNEGRKLSIGYLLSTTNAVVPDDTHSSEEGDYCWNTKTDPNVATISTERQSSHFSATENWKSLYSSTETDIAFYKFPFRTTGLCVCVRCANESCVSYRSTTTSVK